MSEFVQRTLSGAVYVTVVVLSVVYPAPAFPILVAMLSLLAVRELHHLLTDDRWLTAWSAAMAGLLPIVVHSLTAQYAAAPYLVALYGVLLLTVVIAELFRKAENPIQNWAHLCGAQLMVAVPFALMTAVLNRSQWLMLAVFVLIWVNDSMAYCTGSLMHHLTHGHNHKMFPRVSPGKSWEGLVGGIVFALIGGYVFSLFVPEFVWCQWLFIALFIAGFGTLGDLIESLFKRTIGVKDSGRFMPGHGGVLDRFDSLLLATSALWLLLLVL